MFLTVTIAALLSSSTAFAFDAPLLPPTHKIVVNIPATELILYENDRPISRYRVAIGQGIYPTPEQRTFIRKVEWNPWWYPPPDAEWAKDKEKTPPGPENPLGLVKIPLDNEILFHGTNESWTVGRPASHGCMRMHNSDVTNLAWFLQKRYSEKSDGTLREKYRTHRQTTFVVQLTPPIPVEMIYEPVIVRGPMLELYPDYYHRLLGRYEAAILLALFKAGIALDYIDAVKVKALTRSWKRTTIPIEELVINRPRTFTRLAPECS